MIVISNKPGQLGNRLFVFAHLIAFAKEHSIQILNPSFDEYACFFSHTYNNILCQFPAKSNISNNAIRKFIFKFSYYLTRILVRLKTNNRLVKAIHIDWDEKIDLQQSDFIDMSKQTKYLFLQGWNIRDSINFLKHADEIRSFFQPLPQYHKNVNSLITMITSKCDILIGVHIRHGDYKYFEKGKYFYDAEEYVKQMKKAASLFAGKRVSFLICSNEQQDKTIFQDLDCHWGTGHLIEDLYSLALCNYIIGPPSTYSMWASFYGRVPLYQIKAPLCAFTSNSFTV